MSTTKFILGFLWALPVTLLFFVFYVLPTWILGWYKFDKWHKLAWVWNISTTSPVWFQKFWRNHFAKSFGNIILIKIPLKESKFNTVMNYEIACVKQAMCLGIFHPVIQLMNFVSLNILSKFLNDKNINVYYDDPFAIHARRSSNQIIDIVGFLKKIEQYKIEKKT